MVAICFHISLKRQFNSVSHKFLKVHFVMNMSEELPSDIEEAAANVVSGLLPAKSKEKYEKMYQRFVTWCETKNIKSPFQEKVLLVYFETLAATYSSSSLWSFYSMLRATISTKNNVDISKYTQLQAFLKRKSEGYVPKKSRTFSREEIERFLKEADDKTFLLTKVRCFCLTSYYKNLLRY